MAIHQETKKQQKIVVQILEKTFNEAIKNLQVFIKNLVKFVPKLSKNGKKSTQTVKNDPKRP